MWSRHRVTLAAAAGAVGALLAAGVAVAPAAGASTTSSFVGGFKTITTVASTVPKNGDVNPYGVAVVTRSKDRLHRGDVLVSNFNDKANTQGTGHDDRRGGPEPLRARVRPDQRGAPARGVSGRDRPHDGARDPRQ